MNGSALQRVSCLWLLISLCMYSGCTHTLVLDTPQALPAGKFKIAAGVGGGYKKKPAFVYRQTLKPTGDTQSAQDMPETVQSTGWPRGLPLEYFIRFMAGLGLGFQASLSVIAPTPAYGIGGVLTLKHQLRTPRVLPLALLGTISAREVGEGSKSSRRERLLEGDVGILTSIPDTTGVEPYLAARYRYSRLQAIQDGWSHGLADASSYLMSLGIATPPIGGRRTSVWGRILFELALQYFPRQEGLRADVWHATFGLGFSSDGPF